VKWGGKDLPGETANELPEEFRMHDSWTQLHSLHEELTNPNNREMRGSEKCKIG
jgi:hypothetical protein